VLFVATMPTGTYLQKAIILSDGLHKLCKTPSERVAGCGQFDSGSEDIFHHGSEDDFLTSLLLLATGIGPSVVEQGAAHRSAWPR